MDREKAVEVAKDVIAQLMKPERGYNTTTFSYISVIGGCPSRNETQGKDLREFLDQFQDKGCQVCALGAAVLSKARLYDEVPADIVSSDYGANNEDTRNALIDIFDMKTLDLIEVAYQLHDTYAYDRQDRTQVNAAVAFGKRFSYNRVERMVAIMENVIANNGEFIPEV